MCADGGAHLVGDERGDRTPREDLSDDGGMLDHRALARFEAVEAGGKQGVDRRRQLQVAWIGDETPPLVVVSQSSLVDQHPHELLHEERIAGCRRRDPVARLLPEIAFEQVGDQEPDVVVRELLEHDRRRTRLQRGPERPQVEKLGTGEATEEERDAPAAGAHVFEQVDEDRLGPLQVFDDHEERLPACDLLQEPPERPEDLLGARLAADRQHCCHSTDDLMCVRYAVEQTHQTGMCFRRRLVAV